MSSRDDFASVRFFGSLDGLRALAILAVIWHHTAGAASGSVLGRRGFLGVDLFFVISGFLIATLLLREQSASGTIGLEAFYRRRCLRILPAYWLMLLIVAIRILRGVISKGGDPRLEHEFLYAALYVSNMVSMTTLLSVTWSLSTEEQFYLVIPALMSFLRSAIRWLLPMLYVVSELPAFGFWPRLHLPGFLRQTTFAPIILGVMLAYTLNDPRARRVVHSVLGNRVAAVIALLVSIALCSIPGDDISGWPRLLMQLSFTAVVACCVLRQDNGLRPLLAFPALRRIGTVSYGMYLYHLLLYGIAAGTIHRLGLSSPVTLFALLVALTWAVAEMSYRWYETPFLRRRYDGRGAAVRAVAPA
jgi:peptidoglycan/LPS O-acetylase OafA/YrhL